MFRSAPMSPTAREQAFVVLLDQHAGILRKVAASYSRTSADRHDLMQEISLQLWKAYPRYTPERSFSTWMYRIALNVAISHLRRNSRPSRQTVPLEEECDVAAASRDENEPDERLGFLRHVIAQLEPLSRALLLLYLDDRPYREIASILGLSETNVATKLSRLKQHLRTEIVRLTKQP
ncbi:MAG: sigma-70 family RNA polymerase sigma factor [Verrucomicrobiota bacterium]|nr:sigma-70 family RNA polymerase sigma factor [Verrucomicrobiota bacterium]